MATDPDAHDKSYTEAVQDKGKNATQVGAEYVAEYYRTLIYQGIPQGLAESLTRDFANGMVVCKVHAQNGTI